VDLAPVTPGRALRWPDSVTALRAVLRPDEEVYLVGGAVRDAVLQLPLRDLDLATPGDGQPLARRIADALGGAYYPLDKARGVGRALVTLGGEALTVDVAQFRGPDLLTDLSLRDFTLNALAVRLNGDLQAVYDPLGGLGDLARRVLRQCGPGSIPSDPVRALRAVRASIAYNLRIEPATRAALRANAPRLAEVAPERVRDELFTLLGGPRPAGAIRVLHELGLLAPIVPEAAALEGVTQGPPHQFDVWRHTLRTVEQLDAVLTVLRATRSGDLTSRVQTGAVAFALDRFRAPLAAHLAHPWPNGRTQRSLLIFAALLHDSGKPATRSVDPDSGKIRFLQHEQVGADLVTERAAALRLSHGEVERLGAIVRHHMRPHWLFSAPALTPRAIYRFWRDAGEAGVDVCLLALADYLAIYGAALDSAEWVRFVELVQTLLARYFTQYEAAVAPPPLLSGDTLMQQLGLPPGPEIGALLDVVREAQAVGEVTTPDEALALARRFHESDRRGN